jgi:protein-L-isoaspartate(D-aspartate) O-methyltransferase
MVREQIRARGVTDEAVLSAMAEVPRHQFVSAELEDLAYDDRALPIDLDQTISQPYIVALTIAALKLDANARVLDIGTGSGYAAAVASRIAKEVYSIERHPRLLAQAEALLRQLGYKNVVMRAGDGSMGWPEFAPYQGIMVAATAPAVAASLVQQLAIGGRLVVPIGTREGEQELLRITRKSADQTTTESLGAVRFVPLIGRGGF